MKSKMKAADLFCGAGGTSAGAEASGTVSLVFALNHWDVAIKTHSANFPNAKHVNSRLDMTHPSECPKIDLLFASPECTHHSNARGGRPMEDQKRAGAWDVAKWVEHHRPAWVVVENVREFRDWGPLHNGRPMKSGKGKTFDAWLMALRSLGYQVDHQLLNAADYGAATSRTRLFVVARKGKRSPIFPDQTHEKSPKADLFKWRAAAEVIDWSIPCPSIFTRKRPLADKTLRRIEMGLRKFVGPYIADVNHGDNGRTGGRVYSTADPLGSATTKRGKSLIVPFLTSYYGNSQFQDVGSPVQTITTKDRHCIVCPEFAPVPDWRAIHEWESEVGSVGQPFTDAMISLLETMRELGVIDIGFRMFENHELALAQGFQPGYQLHGTKADITRQIGNSVSPSVAKAISLALAGA